MNVDPIEQAGALETRRHFFRRAGMGLGAAAAGGLAGVVVGTLGYAHLSHGTIALALLVVVAAVLARSGSERLAQ